MSTKEFNRYINSSKEKKVTLFEEGETVYKSVEEIPLNILVEELERRKKEAVPQLIESINQSLKLLESYGVRILNDEDSAFVLTKIEKLNHSDEYKYETRYNEI